MHVFAHLRKCAGTSVIEAAVKSGVTLPPGHRNGHPVGPDGHAVPGLSRLSAADLASVIGGLTRTGVQLVAIEWDWPRVETFPADRGLAFFTILRDPVERFLSNYAYDVVSGFTASRTVQAYRGEGGIWTHDNYYTRFFAGLGPDDMVGLEHVDYVLETLSRRFKYAFVDDDLQHFLVEEVGLPITRLRRANGRNRLRHLLHRASLQISATTRNDLHEANALDRRLVDALRRAKAPTRQHAGPR